MRAHLTRIIAAGAASISEGVREPHEVVDEIFDGLMKPTKEMITAAEDAGWPSIEYPTPEAGWIAMIRAAKEGK